MKHKKKVAVCLSKVTKTYVLHHEKPTFVENFLKRNKREKFTALSKISITFSQGEKIGIIGPNGAGKTTFLKLIAGITVPTSGNIITHGKIVSLIDLEAGFQPDLTGEENIFLNALLIGMSRKKVQEMFKEIIAFSEISSFIDSPLYTYSQGMKLRLGFSIAIHADPDILILDEAVTAGDKAFRQKAGERIKALFQTNKTILVSTHWDEFLRENCQRFIRFDSGKIIDDGSIAVLNKYSLESNN